MKNSLLIAIAAILLMSANVFSQKTTTTNIPVTSTIADSDAANLAIYQIKSDGSSYMNKTAESVISILQSSGEWELDARSSPNRRVYVDFSDPIVMGMQPPIAAGWYPARLVTKCYLLGTNRLNNMPGLNSTLQCPLTLNIINGSNTYRMDMNSVWNPGTDNALVSCTGVVSGSTKCNKWRIEPNNYYNGQVKNLGHLVRVYTSKGKTVEEEKGNFYMNFSITISNP
jgi:hypothetical protein